MQNRTVSLALPARVAIGFLLAVASSGSFVAETGGSEVAENGKQTSGNVVANEDFERGLNGWQAPQEVPGKAEIVPGPHGNCVRLSSTTNETSTYVTQSLDPQRLRGRRVRLEVKMKAENVASGKFAYSHAKIIIIENNGKNDLYHEMDFDGTFDWKALSISWQISSDCRSATLYLGLHTIMGAVWYDDVQVIVPALRSERTLQPGVQERVYDDGLAICVDGNEFTQRERDPVSTDFQPTQAEEAKGFVVYRTEEPADVVPGRAPYRKELLSGATPVELLAAPDQIEPVVFAVWALRPLARVRVEAPELTGPAGARIPAAACDVRLGRQVIQRTDYTAAEYHMVPKLLERGREVGLAAAHPQLFWLSLHVPADAAAGDYSGQITVEAGDQAEVLPVRLRVLPFRLATGKRWMLFFYNSDPADADLYFRDMREHGMTSVILAQVNAPLRREGDHVAVDFTTSDAFVEAYRKAGFDGPLVYNPFHDRLATRLLELFGQADEFPKVVNYGEEICVFKEEEYPPHLQQVYREVVRSIFAHAQQADWPPLLFYAVDEPNELTDWRAVAARMEYRLTKEAVPSARTFCTAYTLAAMKNVEPWLDVRAVPVNSLTTDAETTETFHDHARQAGGEIWGIEWPAMWDGFWRARQLGGYQPAKAGVTSMTAWTYYNPVPWTDAYNDLRGQFKSCHLVYRGGDGELIPTLTWEGIRAGVTDWRYVATLEEAIAKAAGAQRQRGEEALRAILASIPWHTESSTAWQNSRANELRAAIAAAILELQQ